MTMSDKQFNSLEKELTRTDSAIELADYIDELNTAHHFTDLTRDEILGKLKNNDFEDLHNILKEKAGYYEEKVDAMMNVNNLKYSWMYSIADKMAENYRDGRYAVIDGLTYEERENAVPLNEAVDGKPTGAFIAEVPPKGVAYNVMGRFEELEFSDALALMSYLGKQLPDDRNNMRFYEVRRLPLGGTMHVRRAQRDIVELGKRELTRQKQRMIESCLP